MDAAAGQLVPGLVTRLDHARAGQLDLGQAGGPWQSCSREKIREKENKYASDIRLDAMCNYYSFNAVLVVISQTYFY